MNHDNAPELKQIIGELQSQLYQSEEVRSYQAALLEHVRAELQRLLSSILGDTEQIHIIHAQNVVSTVLEFIDRSQTTEEELRAKLELPVAERISHKAFAEEIGISESRLSDCIDQLRADREIETPKGKRITKAEAHKVRERLERDGRPERRKKNYVRPPNMAEF